MPRQVTMAQVASRAGVSRSAVSAAFAERVSTTVLKPATRAQIRKVASELGYEPNILSRAFIKQQSFLIGMLGREAFFLFALDTIKGIEDVLEKTDYSLLTFYHGSWADDQAKHLQKSLSRRVDGMIIVGAPEAEDGPNRQLIEQQRQSGLPIVQLYRRTFDQVPVVMMDDELAGYLSTRHLLEFGHRRIAHVTFEGYQNDTLPGIEDEANRRIQGYRRAMGEAGLPTRVITFDRPVTPKVTGNDYAGSCGAAVEHLMAGEFTAATTFNDYTAIGLIHNLQSRGVRVPEAMSIVGYDNIEAGALMRPAVTTIRPKLFEMGHAAGEMLLRLMDSDGVSDVVMEPELVARGSTAKCMAPLV